MISFLIFDFVILPPEYNWLETYLDNDSLWLEDSIGWDSAFEIALYDYTLYSAVTTPFFSSSFFFLDSIVKISFLDIIFFFESDKSENSREIYDLFLWDVTNYISNKYLPSQFLFYTNYQDFIVILLHYSPELVLILSDYVNTYWVKTVFSYTPAVVFDLFSDSANQVISELVEYFILFYFFALISVLIFHTFGLNKFSNINDNYFGRLITYLYSISKDSRVQFESLLYTFFFFFMYWSMMVATFDDDKEELIELFDVLFFYFFCFIIVYLIFKYSTHYFAFLEASLAEGRSVSYVAKQFIRDFINTFALLLRFFILLFRLNVYDTLDDFYDSYYIFVGDFDDDEYFNELFFSIYSTMFYDFDVNDDRLFSLEDENDFFLDLFYLYFLYWGKFFTFIFFILEEILRLSLGFYICYLIIFDVHAVNASYTEDFYFQNKKNNLPDFSRSNAYFKF